MNFPHQNKERRHCPAVGYGRFVGLEATAAVARLYAAARLHGNLFQLSFNLREKTRIGARVIKRYHSPAPPAERALLPSGVAETDKLRPVSANRDTTMLASPPSPGRRRRYQHYKLLR